MLQDLDLGEAEAIALALDLGANYILMDEAAGRSIALSYNVQPIGVLGILLKAKQKGMITSVTDLMDSLRLEANFYVDTALYEYVKRAAGE